MSGGRPGFICTGTPARRCGAVRRCQLTADAGQDALAVVSLIAPAVVFIFLVLELAAMNAAASARAPVWTLLPVLPSFGESVVMLAWLAVVVLGLAGRRGAAAAISLTLALLALLVVLTAIMQPSGNLSGGLLQFLPFGNVPVVLASLAACSLALSPGLLRGLAIAVAVAVTCVRSPAGRRVAGLAATGLLPSLAVTLPLLFSVLMLISLLVAVLVWPVAIVSWRGRVRQAVLFARSDRSYSRGPTDPSSDRAHVRRL